jgi:hypothetical protein
MLRRAAPDGDWLERPSPRGLLMYTRAPLGGWGFGTVPANRARVCADCVPIFAQEAKVRR